MVYLCEECHIPHWMQLLNKDTVIRVPIEDTDTIVCQIGNLVEHIQYTPVTSSRMAIIPGYAPTKESNIELCLSYLWAINRNCMRFIRYYAKCSDDTLDEIIGCTETLLKIFRRLDFQSLTADNFEPAIQEMVESCCYTFTDTYNNTGKRIWEQLVLYPKDESMPIRKELHGFIKKNLKPILYANTGGWLN